MTRSRILIVLAGLAVLLGACDTVSEFRGRTGAATGLQGGDTSLTVPPGYGSRPESGVEDEERSGRTVIQRASRGGDAVEDGSVAPGERSRGEDILLRESGYEEVRDPVVQRTLDIEARHTVARERQFVEKLLRWDPERSEEADTSNARSGLSARPIIRRRGEF